MITLTIQPCEEFRQALPGNVREFLDDMIESPVSSVDAEILYSLLPKHLVGAFLRCLPCWEVPTDVLQECTRKFWKIGNRVILNTPGFSLERAREMFRVARFPLPADIALPIRVWRGTAGKTLEEACEGMCWTTDRDAACWFATLYKGRDSGDPIVVTTTVVADQILFIDQIDGHYEKEVVLGCLVDGQIDPGAEAEWRKRAFEYIKRRREFWGVDTKH